MKILSRLKRNKNESEPQQPTAPVVAGFIAVRGLGSANHKGARSVHADTADELLSRRSIADHPDIWRVFKVLRLPNGSATLEEFKS